MKWNEITSIEALNELKNNSSTKAQLIFKHSTACPVSAVVKSRFEMSGNTLDLSKYTELHLINILANRAVSNAVASEFGVTHESPQLLLIKNKTCIYHTSHSAIDAQSIVRKLEDETTTI